MRRWIVAAVPLVVALVIALVLLVTRTETWLVITVRLSWFVVLLGLAVTAGILIWRWVGHQQRRR